MIIAAWGCLPHRGCATRWDKPQGLKPNAARQTVLCYTRRYSGVGRNRGRLGPRGIIIWRRDSRGKRLAVDVFFILSGVVVTNAYEYRLQYKLSVIEFINIR